MNVRPGASMTEENKQLIVEMIKKNEMIPVIELVRDMTGMGLKEAKDYVEDQKSKL